MKINLHWFDAFDTNRSMISAAGLGSEVLLACGILLAFRELQLHLQVSDVVWPLHCVHQQVHWLHVAAKESLSWIVFSCWPAWRQYESWSWSPPVRCWKLETAIIGCQAWSTTAHQQWAWQWDATCRKWGNCSWTYATHPLPKNFLPVSLLINCSCDQIEYSV